VKPPGFGDCTAISALAATFSHVFHVFDIKKTVISKYLFKTNKKKGKYSIENNENM